MFIRWRLIIAWSLVLFSAFIIFVAIGAYSIATLLPEYRHKVEAELAYLTDSKVSFETSTVKWEEMTPVLTITHFKLQKPDGGVSVKISKIQLELSLWKSLLSWRPSANSVVVDGLKVRAKGTENKFDWTPLLTLRKSVVQDVLTRSYTWLASQEKIKINHAMLTLDMQKGGSISVPFTLDWQQDKTARYGYAHYTLTAKAQVENNAKNSTSLTVNINKPGFFSKPKVNVRLNYMLQGRSGAVKLPQALEDESIQYTYNGIHGVIYSQFDLYDFSGINANIDVKDFIVSREKKRDDLAFDSFKLKATWLLLRDGWSAHVFPEIKDDHGRQYIFKDVGAASLSSHDGQSIKLHAGLLDLRFFSRIKNMLFAPGYKDGTDSFKEQFYLSQFSGLLQHVKFSFKLKNDRDELYQLSSEFKDVSWLDHDGKPILKGLAGQFKIAPERGSLSFNAKDFILGENAVFEKGWPALKIDGGLQWTQERSQWLVNVRDLKLSNKDIDFQVNGNLNIPSEHLKKTKVNITSSLKGENVGKLYARFLPRSELKPKLYTWLVKNIISVEKLTATMKMIGVLDDFLYDSPDSEFSIHGKVKNASITPDVGWPLISEINGEVNFDGPRFTAIVNHAKTMGITLHNGEVVVPNIAAGEPSYIGIKTTGEANGNQGIEYALHSPLSKELPQFLKYMTYSGKTKLGLNLKFPLDQPEAKDEVNGFVQFEKGMIYFKPLDISLYNINSDIIFDKDDFEIKNLTGWFDQQAFVSVKSTQHLRKMIRHNDEHLKIEGMMPASLFNKWMSKSYQGLLSGYTAFKADVDLQPEISSVLLTSDLYGLQSAYPYPFSKNKYQILPFKLHAQRNGDKLKLTTTLGDRVNVGLSSQLDQSAQLDLRALMINANLNHLNVEHWLAFLTGDVKRQRGINYANVFPVGQSLLEQTDRKNILATCIPMRLPYDCLFRKQIATYAPSISMKVKQLSGWGISWKDVDIDSHQTPENWQLTLHAKNAADGALIMPYNVSQPWNVNYKLLDLSDIKSGGFGRFDMSALQLANLPAVNMSIENLQLGKLKAEHFQVALKPMRLGVEIPAFMFSEKGTIFLGAAKAYGYHNNVEVNVSATSSNWGDFIDSLGYQNYMVDGSGALSAKLSWDKTLLPQIDRLDGSFMFNIKDGVIEKIKPGVAKLIGVFSVESYIGGLFNLKTSLSSTGLFFNKLLGNYKMHDGIAKTSPQVQVFGPSFDLLMNGEINFKDQEIDQEVKVQPHFSGSMAVAAGFVGGPLVGVVTFMADKLIGSTLLADKGLVDFRVSGAWGKPKIEVIE